MNDRVACFRGSNHGTATVQLRRESMLTLQEPACFRGASWRYLYPSRTRESMPPEISTRQATSALSHPSFRVSNLGAMPTALGGHGHAKPWPWHPTRNLCCDKALVLVISDLRGEATIRGVAPSQEPGERPREGDVFQHDLEHRRQGDCQKHADHTPAQPPKGERSEDDDRAEADRFAGHRRLDHIRREHVIGNEEQSDGDRRPAQPQWQEAQQ